MQPAFTPFPAPVPAAARSIPAAIAPLWSTAWPPLPAQEHNSSRVQLCSCCTLPSTAHCRYSYASLNASPKSLFYLQESWKKTKTEQQNCPKPVTCVLESLPVQILGCTVRDASCPEAERRNGEDGCRPAGGAAQGWGTPWCFPSGPGAPPPPGLPTPTMCPVAVATLQPPSHLHGAGEEDARIRRQLLHVEVHGAQRCRSHLRRAPAVTAPAARTFIAPIDAFPERRRGLLKGLCLTGGAPRLRNSRAGCVVPSGQLRRVALHRGLSAGPVEPGCGSSGGGVSVRRGPFKGGGGRGGSCQPAPNGCSRRPPPSPLTAQPHSPPQPAAGPAGSAPIGSPERRSPF